MSRYTMNNIEMPGVTSILDLLDKSSALMQWAVNSAIKYIEENIEPDGGSVYYSELKAIMEGAKYEYKNISKQAMNIGSIVHDVISQYIKAKINNDFFDPTTFMNYPPEAENAYLAFLEWEDKNIAEYIESEQPVCSLWFCYAGTLDLVARMKNGGVYVIDFKSSKGFYDGYAKQIAAYRFARIEKKTDNKFSCQFKSDDSSWEKTIIQKPINIDGIGVLRLDKETGLPEWKDYSKNYIQKHTAFLKLLDFYYADKKRRLKNNPRVENLK